MTATCRWPVPAGQPWLAANEVHAWLSSLHVPAARRVGLLRILSAAERERAARFRFARHRWQFIVARATLRTILGRYLGVPPGHLHLAAGTKGKPYLVGPPSGLDLRFNLSHSGDFLLLGVAVGREVGIDIEQIRPDVASDGMARTSFSAREVAVFRALAPAHRTDGFFECWSRKEAFIKATGEGVSYGLQDFDVSLGPVEEPRLLASRKDPGARVRWTLRALAPVSGYAAAVVAEGRDWILRCFHWPSEWALAARVPSWPPAGEAPRPRPAAAGGHAGEIHA